MALKHHPYTEMWPLLEGADLEALQTDIKANGLRMPVITYEGMTLDGRNRELACEAVGVTVRYEVAVAKTDREALALVVSLNQHRRHLSLEARAFAAQEHANMLHGSNRYEKQVVEGSIDLSTRAKAQKNCESFSLTEAANAWGISTTAAKRARAIKTHGTTADIADVRSGKATLSGKVKEIRQRKQVKSRGASPPVDRPIPGLLSRAKMPALTREQVDPEFKGTPTQYLEEYGHCQVMTAEQRATMRFDAWAGNMRTVMRTARNQPDWPKVDHNWLRKPGQSAIRKLTEALGYLRPILAEAEALLATATAAAAKKDSEAA